MATEENQTNPRESIAQPPKVSSFSRHVLITVGILTLIALLILLLIKTYEAFLLALGGILLAIFLRGIADWLHKWLRIPKTLSVIISTIILVGTFLFFVWFMSARMIGQFTDLYAQVSQSMQRLEQTLSRTQLGRILVNAIPQPQQLLESTTSLVREAAGIFSTTIGIIMGLTVVLFIGFYLALDPDVYVNGVLRLFPLTQRERVLHVMNALAFTLRWWIIGRIIAMVTVGALTGLSIWALGIPLALALGVLVGLLTFIPYVGAIVAFIPVLVLAMAQGMSEAFYALLLYIAIHIVEGYFLSPLVEQKAVALPPSLTLFVQVVAIALFGIFGIILAAPITAMGMVLLRIFYVKEILGDEIPETRSRKTDAKIKQKNGTS